MKPLILEEVISLPNGCARLLTRKLSSGYRLSADERRDLAPQERALLDDEERPDKMHAALFARVMLRRTLADIISDGPDKIELQIDPHGRRRLHARYGIDCGALDFSVSHAPYGVALCLAYGYGVRVDIQRFTERQEKNFTHVFLAGQSLLQPAIPCYAIWTRMEAFGKMQGEGLNFGMKSLYAIAVQPDSAPIKCQFYDFQIGSEISVGVCVSL